MQQGYLWLLTYAMFLVGLALFIPSAFSSAWVKIPFSANISSDDASGDVADMMAGLWTDCNVTTHICDDYNTAYLDASAALVIASTVTTIISSLTYMLPWLASIGQVITGLMSLVAVSVFAGHNGDLHFGWSVAMFSIALTIFLVNGTFTFIFLGYPDLKRVKQEVKVIGRDVRNCCCYCSCCTRCCRSNAVDHTDTDIEQR